LSFGKKKHYINALFPLPVDDAARIDEPLDKRKRDRPVGGASAGHSGHGHGRPSLSNLNNNHFLREKKKKKKKKKKEKENYDSNVFYDDEEEEDADDD
jgi:hypothetical protein